MRLFAFTIITLLVAPIAFGDTADPTSAPAKAFHPGDLWPDNHGVHINAHGGGLLLDNGTYYWFGEHKIEGKRGNAAHVGVHCYTSTDLYNWTDAGIALPIVKDDPSSDIPNRDLVDGCILERPKVLRCPATGKYVMWFHLELVGQGYKAARAGVAVADHPAGPYHYLGSFRLNAGQYPVNADEDLKRPHTPADEALLRKNAFPGNSLGELPADAIFRRDFSAGQMSRDQTLFQDDDGRAYQITASEENATLMISRLSDDYTKPSGEFARIFPGQFHEAPAMFKHDGRYYLITSHCTGWAPNPARSAVADHIYGPYKDLGNPCTGPHADKTFDGQSTYVLPLPGKKDAYIFLADRWRPTNAIDGRYLWLPIDWQDGRPVIRWHNSWDLSYFDHK